MIKKLTTTRKLTATWVFVIVLGLSLIAQGSLWFVQESVDHLLWEEGIRIYHEKLNLAPEVLAFGYPGTTIILPGSLLMVFGLDKELVFMIVMTVILSILIACIGVVLFKIRPKKYWWLLGTSQLLLAWLYIRSTPPLCPNCSSDRTYNLIAFVYL